MVQSISLNKELCHQQLEAAGIIHARLWKFPTQVDGALILAHQF